MKPVFPILVACCCLAACNSKDPNAEPQATGVCKENSDKYLSITHDGNQRTSLHDGKGQARIIFLGGKDSLMRVYVDIDSQGTQPRVMLNAVMPAGNATGIYHADSTGLNSQDITLEIAGKRYYSIDLVLTLTSLGNYTGTDQYGIKEYEEAAGSFSGSFIPDFNGGQLVQASGEFCVDYDGKTK